jgi:branched-chain amino acid transport system substrate-binding protein
MEKAARRATGRSSTRLVASVSAAALMLLLAACSSSSSGQTGSAGSSPATTSPAGQPSGTATASAAVSDYLKYTGGKAGRADGSASPVTVGWVNQQGGSLAFPAATSGAQAAVSYINSHLGGIGGHPLRLATCFVASAEAEGTTCGQQLVNNPAVKAILYGTMITGDQSLQAVDNGQKPILMGNAVSPADGSGKNVYIYNGTPNSIFGGVTTYLTQEIHAKHVAILYPQTAQAIAGLQVLQKDLQSDGVTVKGVGYDPSAADLTAPAVASGAQSADAVVTLSSTPPLCVATAKALNSLGVKTPIVAAGSFCFSQAVSQGLGGELPHWDQLSVQSNVADSSQSDVKAYLSASSTAGLTSSAQATADAPLSWSLVMTAARLLNQAGASATPAEVAHAAKSFTGPMMLGSPQVDCGHYASAPALCGASSRVFRYAGNGEFTAETGWLKPTGL